MAFIRVFKTMLLSTIIRANYQTQLETIRSYSKTKFQLRRPGSRPHRQRLLRALIATKVVGGASQNRLVAVPRLLQGNFLSDRNMPVGFPRHINCPPSATGGIHLPLKPAATSRPVPHTVEELSLTVLMLRQTSLPSYFERQQHQRQWTTLRP